MLNRESLLRYALVFFGIGFLLVYPLAIVWPSGWAWHQGAPYESQYFMMIIGVYATLGFFLDCCVSKPPSESEPYLVHYLVKPRSRWNHDCAISKRCGTYGPLVG
jgi:hypothetical protein